MRFKLRLKRYLPFLLLSFFFFSGALNLLKAQSFPRLTAEDLDGNEVQLPEFFAGKYALIGIGVSKKAEDDLKTWQVPVYNKFIAKTGLMDDMYNVKVVFLPVFTGAMKMAKEKVVKKIKEENEALILENMLVYSGDWKIFEDMGLTDKNEPYFFLINKEGKIAWSASGQFRQDYFDRIESILTQ